MHNSLTRILNLGRARRQTGEVSLTSEVMTGHILTHISGTSRL
jgi:hypothetical protein